MGSAGRVGYSDVPLRINPRAGPSYVLHKRKAVEVKNHPDSGCYDVIVCNRKPDLEPRRPLLVATWRASGPKL